jgi:hypothetical protein
MMPKVEYKACAMHLWTIGALLLAASVGACATNSELVGQIYVAPGKYQYYRCPEIVTAITSNTTKERELTELVNRAGQNTSGVVVGVLAYQKQLAIVREELRQLREVSAQKNCKRQ